MNSFIYLHVLFIIISKQETKMTEKFTVNPFNMSDESLDFIADFVNNERKTRLDVRKEKTVELNDMSGLSALFD